MVILGDYRVYEAKLGCMTSIMAIFDIDYVGYPDSAIWQKFRDIQSLLEHIEVWVAAPGCC